ncbi:hypothetical protein D3C87_29150 [compost metagenome]
MKKIIIIHFVLLNLLIGCNNKCDFDQVKELIDESMKLNIANKDCMFEADTELFQKRITAYLVSNKNRICLDYFYGRGLKNRKDVSEAISLTICRYNSYNYTSKTEDSAMKSILDESIRMIIRKKNHVYQYKGPG